MTIRATTTSHLHQIRDRWNDLHETRLKGTPRPTIATYRHDRTTTTGDGFGYLPDPLHIDVLDTMAHILATLVDLHEHVAHELGRDRLDSTPGQHPGPYVDYIVALLPELDDGPLLARIHRKAEALRKDLLTALGEMVDGLTLDAVCPFCVGQTTAMRAGLRTLRIREIDGGAPDGGRGWAVVCENPDGCRPFNAECGHQHQGKPAWPTWEWEWLSGRLLPARDVA